MTNQEIQCLLEEQRDYYRSGATLSVSFRKERLKELYKAIRAHRYEINDALREDLGKSHYEGFMCESGLVLTEITYLLKHIRRFTKRKTVHTPLAQFPSHSYKQAVPYGNTLIMSPWNYPFLLTMEPLADAIAAGNTAIIKPSAYSPATSRVVADIIRECFPPKYVAVVTGGRAENAALLDQKFDFVFFTGSQAMGKEVLRHTAEHLTPAVLELGGKSPCIVDATADIQLAARRIVFGKFLNCGQTCVAPDHILCENSVKDEFLRAVISEIQRQFGEDPLANRDYGRIINPKHFERLRGLMDGDKVVFGGVFGDVSESKAARKVAIRCMKECMDVGHAAGAEFAPVQGKNITALFYYKGAVKRAFATMLIPIAMKKHRNIEPSMLQDLKKGKPCEIDAINGVVCEWGRKYGVPTPINDRIVAIIKECERGERKPSPENLILFDDLL